jgi:hypothetical protein
VSANSVHEHGTYQIWRAFDKKTDTFYTGGEFFSGEAYIDIKNTSLFIPKKLILVPRVGFGYQSPVSMKVFGIKEYGEFVEIATIDTTAVHEGNATTYTLDTNEAYYGVRLTADVVASYQDTAPSFGEIDMGFIMIEQE